MYQPTGQGAADSQLQGYFNNYSNPYSSVAGNSQSVMNAGYNNPYASNYQNLAQQTQSAGWNQGFENFGLGSSLYNSGLSGLSNVNSLQGSVTTNPYASGAIGSAQTGGNLLQQQSMNDLSNIQGLQSAAARQRPAITAPS